MGIKLKTKNGDISLTAPIKTIKPITEEVVITPDKEEQIITPSEGKYFDKVTVEAIESDKLEITPSAETQEFNGLYDNVKVAGDSNLIAENIKSGVSIFGVEGNIEVMDTSQQAIIYSDFNENGQPTKATLNTDVIGDTIPASCFYSYGTVPFVNSALEEIIIPNTIKTINTRAFYGVKANFQIPESVETIDDYCCNYATGLKGDVVLHTQKVPTYVLANNPNITSVRLTKVNDTIKASAFYGCSSLKAVIIETTSRVISIANSNVFNSTPIKSGTGYVYVPDNLVESYKSATNWSTYASQIKGMSELI